MNFSSGLVQTLLIMVVLIAFILPGYILRKKKMIGDNVLSSLSNILLYVCQPFLMIKAFSVNPIDPTEDILYSMLWTIALTLVSMLAVFGVSKLVFQKPKDVKKKGVYSFISVFSNCGFIGIPFVDIMTGGNGEAVMYVAVYNFGFNILVWTLGVYLMTQNVKDINLKRAFLNPSMIGGYIGLLFFFVPQINIFNLEDAAPLSAIPVYFGYMTTVLSMIIVGVCMADIPLKKIFVNPGGYVASALRLIVSPLIVLALAVFVDKLIYPFNQGYVVIALVVAAAMSPAASCVAYAEKFGGDKDTAASTFILGTLLGIITIPLIVAALSALYI